MRNGIRVIDSHSHVYPAKIAEKAVAGTDKFYGTVAALDGTPETLRQVMDEAGIDLSIICSVATTPHQVSSINRFIAATAAASGGRMIGLGTLHPESEDIAADVDELLGLGLRGVKLHPDIQGFKLDDYRCLKMYELCEGKIPMLLHTGDARYDFSNPNRLIPLLETYTELRFIGAHFGGYSIWDEALKVLPGYPNLWVDCSSTFFSTGAGRAEELIDAYGADRVLFGTDYPMWDPRKELDTFLALGLPREELELILHGNAEKVFDLS